MNFDILFNRLGSRIGNRREKKEKDAAFTILIGIVLMFLICHAPRNIMNWFEFIKVDLIISCQITNGKYYPPYWLQCLYMFGELAIVFNSCLNFVVYFLIGSNFRRELYKILRLEHRKSNSILVIT